MLRTFREKRVQALIFLLLSVVFISCGNEGQGNLEQKVFIRLDSVRDREKESISNHFEGLAQAAASIVEDETMVRFYQDLMPDNRESSSVKKLNQSENQILDSHFVHNYGSFYDLLFVDRQGFVFHSIKQESDHHTNLLTGALAHTSLSQKLKMNPMVAFVDFEPYGPSGEPAAFFVAPVISQQKIIGWFILQYGSNELNAMLTNREDLGRTGEVYLVNDKALMLSDSRFINKSAVLNVAASTDPVRLAFDSSPGHIRSTDYRGVGVFSSYTTLEILGVTWVIIVEIDEDEILSEFYLKNKAELLVGIISGATKNMDGIVVDGVLPNFHSSDNRVDMNEVLRVDHGDVCWTPGVGPCTALVAYNPGKFGYLLHLSPTDDVYIDDPLTRVFLGTKRMDLVNKMMDRLAHFDLVDNDLRLMEFVIVATHSNSLEGILETLLKRGIDLSQIRVAYNDLADYANVSFNQKDDEVTVEWVTLNPDTYQLMDACQLDYVAELLTVFSK